MFLIDRFSVCSNLLGRKSEERFVGPSWDPDQPSQTMRNFSFSTFQSAKSIIFLVCWCQEYLMMMKLKNIRSYRGNQRRRGSTRTCRDYILVTTWSKTTSIWTEFALDGLLAFNRNDHQAMCWCFRLVHQCAVWMGTYKQEEIDDERREVTWKRTHHVHQLTRIWTVCWNLVISHKCEETKMCVSISVLLKKWWWTSSYNPFANDAEHHNQLVRNLQQHKASGEVKRTLDSKLDVRKRNSSAKDPMDLYSDSLFMRQVTTLELIGISVKTRFGQRPSLPMKFHCS